MFGPLAFPRLKAVGYGSYAGFAGGNVRVRVRPQPSYSRDRAATAASRICGWCGSIDRERFQKSRARL